MLRIRQMAAGDIDLGLRLKEQAGWNQTPADWMRFLELEPAGCFVAESDGSAVGTTTTCLLGTVGWIAMVLVEKSARNSGIGTRLVEHAVSDLLTRGAQTIRLDATAHGEKVYRKLGFAPDYELVRMQGTSRCPQNPCSRVIAARPSDVGSMSDLDIIATGTARRRLLDRLISEAPARCGCILRDQKVAAYAMWRPGAHANTLGPAIAREPADGSAVLDWILGECHGKNVFVDLPSDNSGAMAWAASWGLDVQRHFLRMHLGMPVNDRPHFIWASSGPEKG